MSSPIPDPAASGPAVMRKDVRRTRTQVLEAAKELFADRGVGVGFDEIAKHAGVGVGTVYRRFPCREVLVEALFADKLERIRERAAAAQRIADPWEALVWFCESSIAEQQCDRGLTQVLARSATDAGGLGELREEIGVAVEAVVRRAQDAGAVRLDLAYADLAVCLHLLSRMGGGEGEVWRRYLALFLDSIRSRPDQAPLPGPAPTFATIEEIARRL